LFKASFSRIFSKSLVGTAQAILITGLLVSLVMPGINNQGVLAAGELTIQPITWNIIGLDSNNVNVGPNHFPIGARVCNTTGVALSPVTVTFNWYDGLNKYSGNAYINLRGGTLDVVSLSLPANQCEDAYFEVAVTRDPNAYRKTRNYSITAQYLSTSVTTPQPRQLYVEYLISQSRNSVTDMQVSNDGVSFTSIPNGGSLTLMVGQTYFIKLVGKTATNGYEQIESFINFPNTIFQVLSVDTTYTADTSATVNPPYDQLYGDGCVWENNPSSPNYRSCLSTGKLGGDVTVTYEVKIISMPSALLVNPEPLSTLIYDFSGASYHYNSDFGVSTRYANIVNASIEKSFSPKRILPGGTADLTFTIRNPGPEAISGVSFADTLPLGTSISSTAITYTNCGSPSPATGLLTVGQIELNFSNITVAGLGACTITVKVTSLTNNTYLNTTGPLYIGDTNTGSVGTDTLVVSSMPAAPSTCATPVEMARWEFSTAGSTTFLSKATDVSFANATFSGTSSGVTGGAGAAGYWWGRGWIQNNNPAPPAPTANDAHFQFAIDTSNYGGVFIQFSARINANGNWTGTNNNLRVWHSVDNAAFTLAGTDNTNLSTTWNPYSRIPNTTGVTNTRFRIQGYYAHQSQGADAEVWLDNVVISGCARPSQQPTLSKTFSPTSIRQGGSSTLTFTITNPNTISLGSVAFQDILPEGLVVASPNGLSGPTCTTGSISGQSISAISGERLISLSGATLTAGASCSFSVNVLGVTAGQYTNVTSPIESTAGVNLTASGSGKANLNVLAPPIISKNFGATNLLTNGTISLSFTISNPNNFADLTGVAFTDTLPAGLLVADPNGLTGTCGGGTITAIVGSGSISLSGATLAASASCTFSVNVTGTTTGEKVNSVKVSSTNGGDGNTSTASLLVRAPVPGLALSKKVGSGNLIDGVWLDYLVDPPGPVYYLFTIENTGDVDFTSLNISDPLLNPVSCTWYKYNPTENPLYISTTTLPYASADGDPIAYCIVGPVNTVTGITVNTAQASGVYGGVTNLSNPDSATYQLVPTAISLSQFEITANFGQITLNWATILEIDSRGFNIYRATDPDGPAVLVNSALIDSQTWLGQSISPPYEYQYIDTDVLPGVVYFYWLEEISTSGQPTLYGPESVLNPHWIYLPALRRP
jgi:uncharacterized repeat protein (TIGR01451 family)